MQEEIQLLHYFQVFIRESASGKRRTVAGKKLAKGTVDQYKIVAGYLQQYELQKDNTLRIKLLYGNGRRNFLKEKNYWEKFRQQFETYLRVQHSCLDVYIAAVFKVIKTFFNYLRNEKGLPVGEFHRLLRLPTRVYQPVVLDTSQFQRLVADTTLSAMLPENLRNSLKLFLFGCISGLRYSDIMNLKITDIQLKGERYYLLTTSQKTCVSVTIPLPHQLVEMLPLNGKRKNQKLFKDLANSNFNLHIKRIMELAGYTHAVPKYRYRNGIMIEVKTQAGGTYRFCDHITAHTMRRTAITNLLVLGVPEQVVRKLSGHAAGSKEFYRYVSLAQDYTNRQIEAAHEKLFDTGINLK